MVAVSEITKSSPIVIHYTKYIHYPVMLKCDRISENGSKSHMKSIVFLHIFNCISTYI